MAKHTFLLTIEDWSEETPDDEAWLEFITSSLDGGAIDVKCEVYNAAQPLRAADASPAGFEDEEFDALLDSDIDGK